MTDTPPAARMSNLQLRIISAIVLAVVVLAITYAGGVAFRVLAAAIAGAMFYEWSAMSRRPGGTRGELIAAGLLAVVMIGAVLDYSPAGLFALLAVSVIVSLADSRIGNTDCWAPAGLAYAGLSGLSLAFLRGDDGAGLVAVLFLFVVVWATDIFAYFVGRALGGPKLAPSISPGKTQSGALGGAVGGVLAGAILAVCAGAGNLPLLAFVALLLSIVSQAGDLFESWVKRRHGAKDSGRLIPGHGGVMDRVDGLVVAALTLYAVSVLLAGWDNPAQALFAA